MNYLVGLCGVLRHIEFQLFSVLSALRYYWRWQNRTSDLCSQTRLCNLNAHLLVFTFPLLAKYWVATLKWFRSVWVIWSFQMTEMPLISQQSTRLLSPAPFGVTSLRKWHHAMRKCDFIQCVEQWSYRAASDLSVFNVVMGDVTSLAIAKQKTLCPSVHICPESPPLITELSLWNWQHKYWTVKLCLLATRSSVSHAVEVDGKQHHLSLCWAGKGSTEEKWTPWRSLVFVPNERSVLTLYF